MFLQWKKGFYKLETKPICYKTSWSSFGRSFLQSYSQVLQLIKHFIPTPAPHSYPSGHLPLTQGPITLLKIAT